MSCKQSKHVTRSKPVSFDVLGARLLKAYAIAQPMCDGMSIRLFNGRRVEWTGKHRHWQLRRPKFPRANNRGMGAVTSPLGFLATRHTA